MTIGRGAKEGEKTRSEAQQRLNVPAVNHYSGIGKWAATSLTALIRGSFKPERLRSSTEFLCMSVGELPSLDRVDAACNPVWSIDQWVRFIDLVPHQSYLSDFRARVGSFRRFCPSRILRLTRSDDTCGPVFIDWLRIGFVSSMSTYGSRGLSASMRLALGSFVTFRE
jgi:hypothetical protein